MYIISTFVLIHYELELGLFTYFVTFYDISKQNLFTLLVGINIQWFPSLAT